MLLESGQGGPEPEHDGSLSGPWGSTVPEDKGTKALLNYLSKLTTIVV